MRDAFRGVSSDSMYSFDDEYGAEEPEFHDFIKPSRQKRTSIEHSTTVNPLDATSNIAMVKAAM